MIFFRLYELIYKIKIIDYLAEIRTKGKGRIRWPISRWAIWEWNKW